MKFEISKEFINEVETLIENSDSKGLLTLVGELHPADIAEVLDELDSQEANYLFKLFGNEQSADILVELEEDVREKILDELSTKEIAEGFIENLDSDDAADLISELSEDRQQEVISQIEDKEQARDIVDLLRYPEGTAGALMATELIKVNQKWSVMTCVREMRRQAQEIERIHTIYVVNDNEVLLGRLSLKSLLTTSTRTPIEDIYNTKIQAVDANEKLEEVASMMQKYDLFVVPVVDQLGRLLGRITIDDVLDVVTEEAEKDYQLASGISQDVEVDDNVFRLTRARLPWLLVGLIGGVGSAKVIGLFDIEKNIEMAFFIPLIAAMGGNVGVQSSAIIVQSLAKNTSLGALFPRLLKELGVGLLNGFICSAIIFIAGKVFGYDDVLSLTVSLALFTVIIVAALFGTFIPIALDKYKIDPALATGPFITTTNDILGLFIYFYIGKLMFGL